MVSRLMLGCGSVGHAIVESVADWSGSLVVVDESESRVETLRTEGVSATRGDPTDPEVVAQRPAVDLAFVFGDDPEQNRQAARALRDVRPDAYLVVYAGDGPSTEMRADLDELADEFIDPGAALVDHLLPLTDGDTAFRTHELQRTLRDIDGKLGIFMHDNPDPDAIASAVALEGMAESVGTEAEACYFGAISHQENRAFVNLLDLDLRNLEVGADISEFDGLALVDHSSPGVNDQLPEEIPVDVVIDHHPPNHPVEARFVDLRSGVGATSSLLADHLEQLGISPDERVATGLLYGIRVDTKDFTREVSVADFEAASFLLPHADTSTLDRVEAPSISADTFETISRAIRNRELDGTVLASCVGSLSDRDALAQAADRLLNMDGVTVTLVFGFMDGTVYVSARARGTDVDLGETMRAAFGQIGSAGGHADMAGAQIPLGLLGEVEDDEEESLSTIVGDIITDRFFETVRSRPGPDDFDSDRERVAAFDIQLADDE
ncbi:phosphoesterase [Haladaptatus sp. W1]|uniref:DHH family phosphoesterase n=1 Tax=Haladaptatus sp. W1 TaxID=1897478 RepID=UPI000849AEE7|nr:DHH family phosphoesterase [Haladaptatus sp. W1]ODR79701.1 phosphoesterase [Haladaptatus sp. W1]